MRADRQLGWLQAFIVRFAASVAALAFLGLTAAPASAQVSFTRAWGWGVLDGQSQFETCTTTCEAGIRGGGAGEIGSPNGVAVDGSGDVFVADSYDERVDAFSSSGTFTMAWGWGVLDEKGQFETCTTTCVQGFGGGGAGQLMSPSGVAVDGSGDAFVADTQNNRVDEFSSNGAFVKAWGWGVLDHKSQFETCTTTCVPGAAGGNAGQLDYPYGVAVDGSGDVFVADYYNNRVDEFSSDGAFLKAWGWGVADGQSQLEACTTSCEAGLTGGGAGELAAPVAVAVDGSGDVFADDGNDRVDEFSSDGAFIKAWGWGVSDGQSQFETCAATCVPGIAGGGAGQLDSPYGLAVDGSGDVFVADHDNDRVDEFSSDAAFIQAWGWGVADGASKLETCTSACESGLFGGGAGQLDDPRSVAVDGAGDVFVTDDYDRRVDEFGTASIPSNALTVSLAGTGSGSVTSTPAGISCPSTCSSQFERGSQVTLSATASSGSSFAGWSGGGCSGTGTCTVTMSSDEAVSATFNTSPPPQFALTVSRTGSGSGTVTSGDGGIDCGATCSDSYASGTMVTLTATPAAGSSFAGWSGAGCSGTGTCVATMSSAQDVSATFNTVPPPNQTLTVTFAGAGAGTVSDGGALSCTTTCQHQYPEKTIVTLTATPAAGSTFAGWSGAGCSGSGACTVTMSSDEAVSATFNTSPPPRYALTVSRTGSGSGTVTSGDGGIDCGATCSDSYASGTMVTLTALPAAGSTFAGWSGAGCSGSGACTVTMSSDEAVSATFNHVAALAVQIETNQAMVSAGHTNIKLGCTGGAARSSCRGTLSLTIRQKVVRFIRHHRKVTFNTIVLARASYTVASGKTQPVALKLTGALRLLSQAPEQRLRVQAAATLSGGRSVNRAIILQLIHGRPAASIGERAEHRPAAPSSPAPASTPLLRAVAFTGPWSADAESGRSR